MPARAVSSSRATIGCAGGTGTSGQTATFALSGEREIAAPGGVSRPSVGARHDAMLRPRENAA
jgi:hypothetical protein